MKFKSAITLTLSFFALLVFALNAFCVWNWGDDYLLKVRFMTTSPMAFLLRDYFVFDGRSLSPGYIISRICLNGSFPWMATAIASLFFYFSAYLMTVLIAIQKPLTAIERFVLSAVFTGILWLSGFFSHFETLYWQTGMLYVVEVAIILTAYTYLHLARPNTMFLWLLSFIAGMASPGAVIGLLFVLFSEYKLADSNRHKSSTRIAIIGFVAGLLLVVLAPGSHSRFEYEGAWDDFAFSNIHNLHFRLTQFLEQFFELNTPMVWLSILAASLLAIDNLKTSEKQVSYFRVVYEFRWLIAAFISVLFYLPRMMYYIASPRLNIHFYFFCTIFLAQQLAQWRRQYTDLYKKFFEVFQIPVLLTFLFLAFHQLWVSAFCVKKMESRIRHYRQHQGENLVLKANDLIGAPTTREFIDVTYDSSYSVNRAIAQYFGLKSIRKERYR